jgi:hypothetical protein
MQASASGRLNDRQSGTFYLIVTMLTILQRVTPIVISSPPSWKESDMTENEWPQHMSYPEAGATPSKTQAAKEGALDAAQQASDSARSVARTAKSEAAGVAAEAKSEAANLLSEARTQLSGQAASQQQKAASGLRSISDQLQAMSKASDQPGLAADLVRQAAERSGDAAAWLDRSDPAALLDEVASFARRRPGTFLLLAAGAGVLAGRLTRGLSAGAGQPEGGRHRAQTPPAEFEPAGFEPAAGSAVPPPQVDLPGAEAASGSYVPPAGAPVPPPSVGLPGPDATTAGLGGAVPSPAGPRDPLASPQLAEDPHSPAHIADDPLAGKELADDPMGSDPLTRDRRNSGLG